MLAAMMLSVAAFCSTCERSAVLLDYGDRELVIASSDYDRELIIQRPALRVVRRVLPLRVRDEVVRERVIVRRPVVRERVVRERLRVIQRCH